MERECESVLFLDARNFLFQEIFLLHQVGRKPLKKRLYYFSFHDSLIYMLTRGNERNGKLDNGSRKRQKSRVWETFVNYLVSRVARILANSSILKLAPDYVRFVIGNSSKLAIFYSYKIYKQCKWTYSSNLHVV